MKELVTLTSEIFPGKGIGAIFLGMSIKDLFSWIDSLSYKDVKVEALYSRLYQYTYKDSVELIIDILTGTVVSISVLNNFKGKYLGKIGIGSKLKELRELRSDIFWDEEYILVGENYNSVENYSTYELIIRLLNNDYDDIEDLDLFNDYQIKSIRMQTRGWRQRLK